MKGIAFWEAQIMVPLKTDWRIVLIGGQFWQPYLVWFQLQAVPGIIELSPVIYLL